MRKYSFYLIYLIYSALPTKAQSTYMPISYDMQHRLDRLDISEPTTNFHTSVKPYSRHLIIQNLQDKSTDSSNNVDAFNKKFFYTDNRDFNLSSSNFDKKAFLKYFYQYPNALYTYEDDKKNYIIVNPILHTGFGQQMGNTQSIYTNTRGAEIRGKITDKVGFYTQLLETQAKVPTYMQEQVDSNRYILPGAGFIKPFKSSTLGNTYDYLLAKGYITFQPVKNHIDMQFGQDRNFIGNGMRSLILSDYSTDYLFLKVNTKVGRINYMNLFTRLADYQGRSVGVPIQPKYMALHHLSMNVTKNINIGLFESVVFQRKDSTGRSGGFDPAYLNPIIFYRSVEQYNNSADNSLLGMDWKWNFLRHFSWYGQIVLDEFVLSHMRARDGWWGNKYGIQTGLKYIDMFTIKNLDLQAEFNTVRPYTYTHFNTGENYTHYGQPLAHPLGANFYEYIVKLWYQPLKRFTIQATLINSTIGLDSNGSHWGSNIFADYHKRQRVGYPDYDLHHFTGQGVKTNINMIDFRLTWMPLHNLFFDLNYIYRKQSAVLNAYNRNASVMSLALRLNLPAREQWY